MAKEVEVTIADNTEPVENDEEERLLPSINAEQIDPDLAWREQQQFDADAANVIGAQQDVNTAPKRIVKMLRGDGSIYYFEDTIQYMPLPHE